MATLKVPVTADDHIQGNVKAPIKLVEYGDYQCPFCGRAYYFVKDIQKEFGDQLCFVFRNFPLSQMHPYAEAAAETAEIANTKNRFWEMHDLIYENQAQLALGVPLLVELGESLGLSSKEIEKAIANHSFETKIRKDFMGGVKSGVNGTPTFYINGERFVGNPEELESAIVALKEA